MTKEITIKKDVNVRQLHDELESAGFLVEGVSSSGDNLKVMLSDSENKDAQTIITAHNKKTDQELRREAYAAAPDKLAFIAAQLDLV